MMSGARGGENQNSKACAGAVSELCASLITGLPLTGGDKQKFGELNALRNEAALRGEPVLREQSFNELMRVISVKRPQNILEVGSNEGLTSAAMLISLPGARLTAIEIDEDKVMRARKNLERFGVIGRARILCADAKDVLSAITGGYDFIFLDGPKGQYYGYLPDLLRLLKRGGTLFADNVLFRGYVTGAVKTPHRFITAKNSLKNFLSVLTESEGLKTRVLDFEDGVSITEKLY